MCTKTGSAKLSLSDCYKLLGIFVALMVLNFTHAKIRVESTLF